MTWSLALARLPRAAAISKRRHYKQMAQKMKDIPKTWVLTGKQFEDFRRKKTKTLFSTFQKSQWGPRTPKPTIEFRPCKQ